MQVKKYLTKVTEDQQARIRMAAEQVGVTQPEIVQAALDRFFERDWEELKQEIADKKRKAKLSAIDQEIDALMKQREAIQDNVTIPAE